MSEPHEGMPAGGSHHEGTPLLIRLALMGGVVALGLIAWGLDALGVLSLQARSMFGVVCFIGVAASVSANLRRVNPRTLIAGILLQLALAWFVLGFSVPWLVSHLDDDGVRVLAWEWVRPGKELFGGLAWVAKLFLGFSNEGADFVFGKEAKSFAFRVLPTIIFVSAFFSVLYYLGVLQLLVRVMAKVMVVVMGTSGAETLSVSANVFMGQTEAPLIIKPYIAGMTRSELLALMVGGMAHISGSLMAVYIGFVEKVNPEAAAGILATSVMAAPASLYVAKLVLPEMDQPKTLGKIETVVENEHANVIDAAAAGASQGLKLALNVAAMLIAFVAGVYMIDALLQAIHPALSLTNIFSKLFAPVAFLMGVEMKDVPAMADLLGTKLTLNEFVAYLRLTDRYLTGEQALSPRSVTLATYALTGFANFASIGIQIGGIGGMAENQRKHLAELSLRALLAGFLVTLINSSLAGVFLA